MGHAALLGRLAVVCAVGVLGASCRDDTNLLGVVPPRELDDAGSDAESVPPEGSNGFDGSGSTPPDAAPPPADPWVMVRCWHGTLEAAFSRRCDEDADCVVASIEEACCVFGSHGIDARDQVRFLQFVAECGSGRDAPTCQCEQRTYSAGGVSVPSEERLSVACLQGRCTSFVTPI